MARGDGHSQALVDGSHLFYGRRKPVVDPAREQRARELEEFVERVAAEGSSLGRLEVTAESFSLRQSQESISSYEPDYLTIKPLGKQLHLVIEHSTRSGVVSREQNLARSDFVPTTEPDRIQLGGDHAYLEFTPEPLLHRVAYGCDEFLVHWTLHDSERELLLEWLRLTAPADSA